MCLFTWFAFWALLYAFNKNWPFSLSLSLSHSLSLSSIRTAGAPNPRQKAEIVILDARRVLRPRQKAYPPDGSRQYCELKKEGPESRGKHQKRLSPTSRGWDRHHRRPQRQHPWCQRGARRTSWTRRRYPSLEELLLLQRLQTDFNNNDCAYANRKQEVPSYRIPTSGSLSFSKMHNIYLLILLVQTRTVLKMTSKDYVQTCLWHIGVPSNPVL